MKQLDELRERIDAIDNQIAALFQSRMGVCKDVAILKRNMGIPVLNKSREKQVLDRIMGNLPDELGLFAKRVFLTLFEASKEYQSSIIKVESNIREKVDKRLSHGENRFPASFVIACQGIEGGLSHLASEKLFPVATRSFVRTVEDVLLAIEKGESRYGVLQVEDSYDVGIDDAYDLVRRHGFHIVRSTQLPVRYCLLSHKGVKLNTIRQVFAHPIILTQCSEFMSSHGKITFTACDDTAARLLLEIQHADAACIASEKFASIHSLSVLKSNIQNNNIKRARFIAISRDLEIHSEDKRISIIVNLADEVDSFSKLLEKLSVMKLGIIRIESRPTIESSFKLSYYFDLSADMSDGNMINMLSDLENKFPNCTFLGSYDEVQ